MSCRIQAGVTFGISITISRNQYESWRGVTFIRIELRTIPDRLDQGLITTQPPNASTVEGDLGSFEVPQLHVYNDLRTHLLADPVHDVVHGAGWPAVYPDR